MCGRYLIDEEMNIEINKIVREIHNRYGEDSIKTGEIFPSNSAPILSFDRDYRIAPRPARWGFPHWRGSGVIFNARAESAFDKVMFRKPLMTRRCAIPTTGFYEWKPVEGQKKKDKYLFSVPSQNVLYMAGMTNLFKDDNVQYEAYTVLTSDANQSMIPFHNRMPVILAASEVEQWIVDDAFMQYVLERTGPELAHLKV